MTMKNPMETATFNQSIQPGNSAFFPSSAPFSASMACSVEKLSAFIPNAIDWPSTPQPRMRGSAQSRLVSESRFALFSCVTIWPSGLRTATQYECGVRIITPSMTAWPPIKGSSPLSRTGRSWLWAHSLANCRIRRNMIFSREPVFPPEPFAAVFRIH